MKNCRLLDDSVFPAAIPTGQYTALVYFITKIDGKNHIALTFKIFMTAKLRSAINEFRMKEG